MFVELTQRHIEEWEKAIPEGATQKPFAYSGMIVRAAAKAGWFANPIKPEDVDGMKPSKVKQLADAVVKALQEATTISPE